MIGLVSRKLEGDLTAKDVVLLILGDCDECGQLRGITRIEKLGFLLTLAPEFQELRKTLAYSALHYGPYSKEIAYAVDVLSFHDFLKGTPASFTRQLENRADEELVENSQDTQEYVETEDYQLTPRGVKIAQYLLENKMTPEQQAAFKRLMKEYCDLPFRDLMKAVYERAPEEMLAKSRIRGSLR